eukprot:3983341-Alexandrium_andersonii.AAC.1
MAQPLPAPGGGGQRLSQWPGGGFRPRSWGHQCPQGGREIERERGPKSGLATLRRCPSSRWRPRL